MITRRWAAPIVAALVLTGCGPAPAPAPPAPSAPAAPVGITLPPRPRELPLDGVDPCTLLTPTQRTRLGLDQDSVRSQRTAPLFVGAGCSITGFEPRAISVGLTLATGNGIEVLTDPGAVTDGLTPITVAGFPAVLARPRNPDFCSIDVDIADGQFLDVMFRDGGRLPPIPQDQLCRDAPVVAEQVVRTLLAR